MYQKFIIEDTGCTPEEAPCVEAYMRVRFRVLDGLSRKEFKKEAKSGLACVRYDPKEAIELAKSYGLIR